MAIVGAPITLEYGGRLFSITVESDNSISDLETAIVER